MRFWSIITLPAITHIDMTGGFKQRINGLWMNSAKHQRRGGSAYVKKLLDEERRHLAGVL
ncbi:hypothetical protein DMI65_22625 [Escherichia coli]|nr:hypothetical protein [Escherichia coli]